MDDEWVYERWGEDMGAGWDHDVVWGERDGGEVSGEGIGEGWGWGGLGEFGVRGAGEGYACLSVFSVLTLGL